MMSESSTKVVCIVAEGPLARISSFLDSLEQDGWGVPMKVVLEYHLELWDGEEEELIKIEMNKAKHDHLRKAKLSITIGEL